MLEGPKGLNRISSRVSEIALAFETTHCEEYRKTRIATQNILAARVHEGDLRAECLQTAIDAMEGARSEVPDELGDDWEDCIAALQEEIDDE